jgi:hypothetical protein
MLMQLCSEEIIEVNFKPCNTENRHKIISLLQNLILLLEQRNLSLSYAVINSLQKMQYSSSQHFCHWSCTYTICICISQIMRYYGLAIGH